MTYSYDVSTASGTTATFGISFPYLDRSHVHVAVNGEEVDQEDLVWPSSSSVTLPSVPTAGKVVKRWRSTPIDAPGVVFTSGVLSTSDLNRLGFYTLYATQEAVDLAEQVYGLAAGQEGAALVAANAAEDAEAARDAALVAKSGAEAAALAAATFDPASYYTTTQADGRYATLASLTSGLAAKADSASLGAAASKGVGTSAGQLVEVQTGGKLPALDGSNLTGIAHRSRSLVTASGTLAVPAWATQCEIFAVGGGGSGDNTGGGTAGQPGSTGWGYLTFAAGAYSSLTITVGAAGNDTDTNWSTGVAGGTTTVNGGGMGTVTAAGGAGNGNGALGTTHASAFQVPGYGTGGAGYGSANATGTYGATAGAALVYFY